MRDRILNIFLQGATLIARFSFVFFLAKYLSPSEIGIYGLFSVAIGYSIYFVGLDFYTYLSREIILTPMEKRAGLLKCQATLSLILYAIFVPVALFFVINYSGWPYYLVWWFAPILLVEHFNQEVGRLLVALSEQVTASALLFLRQGSWSLLVVFIMFFEPNSRTLKFPMAAWFVSGFFAALLGIFKLKKIGVSGWKNKLDWKWIKKGVAVSAAFLFATLALRGMQTFDRYMLESIGGIEIVGVYVLFIGVAGSLLAFLDSGVFSFTYPTMIALSQNFRWVEARKKVKQMFWLTITFSIIFSAISLAVMPYLLEWIGKDIYAESIDLYYWILLATIVNAISLIPHYALYSAGKDRAIIVSHMLGFLVFFAAVLLLKSKSLVLAVPQGLLIAFLFILVFKAVSYIIFSRSKMIESSENLFDQ